MIRTLTVLVVVGLLGSARGVVAEEIPGYHEFCLQRQRAERIECRAEGMIRRAICIDDFAFGQWIEDDAAATDYNICLAEAKAYTLDCLANDITNCD